MAEDLLVLTILCCRLVARVLIRVRARASSRRRMWLLWLTLIRLNKSGLVIRRFMAENKGYKFSCWVVTELWSCVGAERWSCFVRP
jgi:hypothetical protein